MKTKIFLSLLALGLLVLACQKEALTTEQIAVPNKAYQAELTKMKAIVPDNVEVMPMSELLADADFSISSLDSIITLTDCRLQQCSEIVPNYIKQMQRTANQFCQPMNINICCCAKKYKWCFRFIIHPQFTCAPLEEEKFKVPIERTLSEAN